MSGVSGWLDRNLGRIAVACAVGTCLCFIGLAYLQGQVSHQASDGRQARVQQCKVRSISMQEQQWFHASGVISAAELETVLGAFPSEQECEQVLKDAAKRGP